MAEAAPSSHLPAPHRRSLLAGVLLPPAIFLTALTIRYSLVVAACREGIVRVPLEAAVPLALGTLAFLLLRSWREWRRAPVPVDQDAEPSTDRFMAGLALLTGGLSFVATLALWLPSAFLGPCGTDVA
jgi:hypothetical protein